MTDGTRRCAACGADNLGDARFCAECGVALSTDHLTHPGLAALVDADGPTTPSPDTAVAPPAPSAATTAMPAEPVTAMPATAPPPRSIAPAAPPTSPPAPDRSWVLPTMIVFVVVAIGAVVLILAAGGTSDTSPTSTDPEPVTTDSAPDTTPDTTLVDTGGTDTTTPVETTAPEATTTTPTTTDPTTTVVGAPDAARELAAIAAADFERVVSYEERWVPQLSAKEDGTTWEGVTYDLAGILDLHERLSAEVGGGLLVEGSTLAFLRDGERMAGWWFTLADIGFDEADDALSWCADAGFDRANCAARLVTDRDDATGTLILRPDA